MTEPVHLLSLQRAVSEYLNYAPVKEKNQLLYHLLIELIIILSEFKFLKVRLQYWAIAALLVIRGVEADPRNPMLPRAVSERSPLSAIEASPIFRHYSRYFYPFRTPAIRAMSPFQASLGKFQIL